MSISYVTKDGYKIIKEEFNELWNNLRPVVAEKLNWAASLGDRSENADYQYNKRLLRQIDIRVKQLSDILASIEILDRSLDIEKDKKICFGAYVEIENDDGVIKHLRIVGEHETYNRNGYVSIKSPIAKALLNLSIDDEAIVKTPKGSVLWYVNKVSHKYESWYGDEGKAVFKFSASNMSSLGDFSEDDIKKINAEYLNYLANQPK
jgi:transcription elongation factor GreB